MPGEIAWYLKRLRQAAFRLGKPIHSAVHCFFLHAQVSLKLRPANHNLAGFINPATRYRPDLFFLRSTKKAQIGGCVFLVGLAAAFSAGIIGRLAVSQRVRSHNYPSF